VPGRIVVALAIAASCALAPSEPLPQSSLSLLRFVGPPASASALPPADYPPVRGSVRHVVVVVLDGIRASDVFDGVEEARARRAGMTEDDIVAAPRLMPNLHWLVATRGVALGAEPSSSLVASGPNFVSLPGYLEIFSGLRSSGCFDNQCGRTRRHTLTDELARSGELGDVAVFASWPEVAKAAAASPERMLVSAGRQGTNHPALVAYDEPALELYQRGEAAGPAPGVGLYRPDVHTAALAVRYLRAREPRFLFLSLGDGDEHGHHDDYPRYLESLRFADVVIGEIALALAEMSASGRPTLLLVTTDHGRAASFTDHGGAYPESAQAWLVAAGDMVRARGRLSVHPPRRLADVAPTLRAAFGLPPEASSNMMGSTMSEIFAPPSDRRHGTPTVAWRGP
jgi:hypothetical protein